MDLPPLGLLLVGNVTAWALWGFYTCLFFVSLYVLFFKKAGARNWPLISASIAIFILTTAQVILLTVRLYILVIETPIAQASWEVITSTGPPVYGAAIVLETVTMLIADAVLIWRFWAVYDRRWLVILPSIALWLATLGTTIYMLYLDLGIVIAAESTGDPLPPPQAVFIPSQHPLENWTMVVESLTLAQNFFSTFFIAVRLWAADRFSTTSKLASLTPVLWIVVESGALYTGLWVVEIATSAMFNLPGLLATSQLVTPIVGVTFSLIIVRVGLGLTYDVPTHQSDDTVMTTALHVSTIQDVDVEADASGEETEDVSRGEESLRMQIFGIQSLGSSENSKMEVCSGMSASLADK
ncbi:hypothetical protein DACRYDRAFT_118646 [Dacryopinax primogenitus]|uniref:Uncharacterized protein n=1 Tax=Dacryopinax primogenitus (strain DJM 731) TaxID=1858805 RepID=M5FP95_DACPD|nr:uncharacterized protein DACRYDRAFT_118646 [Dacryopinax primogenitus]EJT98350.1 hypothetical protein DACRYDRAFT_118646 [Dacryopinax primogenitus]